MDDRGFTKRDMRRNEDPEQVSGAVLGATGAGTGAALGALAGPVGVVVGVLAGAVGGWWAGTNFQRAVADVDREDNEFRRAHEHAGATRAYEESRHGYQLGYLAGRNPDHEGASFEDVERDLRAAWVQAHVRDERPVPWEDVRDDVQRGFELGSSRR